MLSKSVELLTQSRKVYYVHTKHPTLERVWGEIEIYDLPLEQRLTPKYISAGIGLGAIDLKSSSNDLIQGYIDWSRIPNADSYRGKVIGWLQTSRKIEFETSLVTGLDDVDTPDYVLTQEAQVFNELANEIVRSILEQDSRIRS